MAGERLNKSNGVMTPLETFENMSFENMSKGKPPMRTFSLKPYLNNFPTHPLNYNRVGRNLENMNFAFEFSPEAILFLEQSGRIMSANPSAMTLLRLKPFSIQDSYFTDFINGAHSCCNFQKWTDLVGDVFPSPCKSVPKKQRIELIVGKEDCVPVEISFVQNYAGHICAFIRDLSEYEGMISRKNDALSKLRSRDHLKSRFMAAMSHEIRTPFNAVSGLLDLLAETELDATQRSLVTTGQEATTALLQITDDLLDYTKIETGNFTLANHPFRAREVFDTVFNLFEPAARNKGLTLYLDVDDVSPLYLSGDLPRLQQVLINFVSNAVKFTETGSVTLWAGTRQLANGKVELTCVVKDTGIGISMDEQARLFGEFYRVEDGDLQIHKGTGLGLAISKTLVRMMDGLIGVNSGAGRGANFWITVPFESVAETEIVSSERLNKSAKCISQQGMNLMKRDESIYGVKVLLADDYKTNQMILTRQLEELGADVTVVNNGEEVLQVLEASKFDIALMDISMPIMGGVQTTEHIRAMQSDVSQLPVLALTAIASDEDRASYLAAGMTDVMTKPISQSVLQRKIFAALDRNRADKSPEINSETHPVSLFDNAILDSIFMGLEPSDVKALTGQFFNDLSTCTNDLERAIWQSDLESIQRASHILKGLAATFGCVDVSKIAELTNYNAINGSVEDAEKNGLRSVELGRDAIKQVQSRFSPYQMQA